MTRAILFLMFLFLFFGASAQNKYSKVSEDFGVWTKVTVKYKWNKKWSSRFTNSYRLKENASELRTFYTQLSLDRDLKKKWNTGVILRYSIKPQKLIFRLSPFVAKSFRFKPLNFKYRLKIDLDWDFNSNSQNTLDETVRNRFLLEYSRKKHRLGGGISGEWFHPIDRDFSLPSNFRAKAFFDFKCTKKIDLKLAYLVQEELNKANPSRDYAFLIAASYKM